MAVHANQAFSGTANVTSGTNTLAVAATDPSGNTATKTYEGDITGTGRAFVYNANGNLTSDGTRTFEWNANDFRQPIGAEEDPAVARWDVELSTNRPVSVASAGGYIAASY
jgi:hypothetical protein